MNYLVLVVIEWGQDVYEEVGQGIIKTVYERGEVAVHNNMLYREVMDEESNQLVRKSFKRSLGEVWHTDNLGLFTSTFGDENEEDHVEGEVRAEVDSMLEGRGEVSSARWCAWWRTGLD